MGKIWDVNNWKIISSQSAVVKGKTQWGVLFSSFEHNMWWDESILDFGLQIADFIDKHE